jgi:hypothetical protein
MPRSRGNRRRTVPTTARRKRSGSGVNIAAILRHLNAAYAASITAALALKHQNADRDFRIAETLGRGVVWPISEAVLEVEQLGGRAELSRQEARA